MLGCGIRHKLLRFFHISIYSIFWKVFDTILLHFKHGYLQYGIKWHCITFKELEGSEEVHINQKKKVVSERLLLVFKVVLICFNNISRGKYLVLCTFEANSWQRKWLMLGFKVGHICVNVILVDNMVLFSFLVKRHHNSDRKLKSLSKHFYKKTSFQHLAINLNPSFSTNRKWQHSGRLKQELMFMVAIITSSSSKREGVNVSYIT